MRWKKLAAAARSFSPLAQGLLTSRYLDGIPADSRAALGHFLKSEVITEDLVQTIKRLNDLAKDRGQTMAQMAIAWVLRDPRMTTAIIGASKPSQVIDCVGAIKNLNFTNEDLNLIDRLCPIDSNLTFR